MARPFRAGPLDEGYMKVLNINMRLRELIQRYEWLKFWFIWQFIFNVFAWLVWLAYYFFDFRPPKF